MIDAMLGAFDSFIHNHQRVWNPSFGWMSGPSPIKLSDFEGDVWALMGPNYCNSRVSGKGTELD